MIGRLLTIESYPDAVGELARVARQSPVPVFEGLPGFRGDWWLADDATGKAVQITLWDSEEDIARMAASPEREAIERQQVYSLRAADPHVTFENSTVIAQASPRQTDDRQGGPGADSA